MSTLGHKVQLWLARLEREHHEQVAKEKDEAIKRNVPHSHVHRTTAPLTHSPSLRKMSVNPGVHHSTVAYSTHDVDHHANRTDFPPTAQTVSLKPRATSPTSMNNIMGCLVAPDLNTARHCALGGGSAHKAGWLFVRQGSKRNHNCNGIIGPCCFVMRSRCLCS